jgi:hypothetical protein
MVYYDIPIYALPRWGDTGASLWFALIHGLSGVFCVGPSGCLSTGSTSPAVLAQGPSGALRPISLAQGLPGVPRPTGLVKGPLVVLHPIGLALSPRVQHEEVGRVTTALKV